MGALGLNIYGYDSSGGYQGIFSALDVGDAKAVAWLIGSVIGDGRDEIIQLWDNSGRLGRNTYGLYAASSYSLLFKSNDVGQGSGAVAWLMGYVNGEAGREQIIQLWDNSGRLGMIVYGFEGTGNYETLFASGDMGQASGAIAWLIGDVNGDGREEIIQLWNSSGRLGMIIYGYNGAGGYKTLFSSTDMGQGSGAVAWLIDDVNGDGREEIIQLWDNGGVLGLIIYGYDGAGGYKTLFGSGNMGAGSGAVAWLIGNVNGDNKAKIIQLWNNSGRLGMTVYGYDGTSSYKILFSSTDMGQGSGAVAWLIGDINGDGRPKIIQLWDNGGVLGLIIYGYDGAGGYKTLFGSGNMGAGSGAVAWLIGDVNGDYKDEIIQLRDSGTVIS